MHRSGKVYEAIREEANQLLIDYEIKEYPLDIVELCNKLSIRLCKYSDLDKNMLMVKSNLGFFVKESKDQPPTIFYNDSLSIGTIRFTIAHEIKHFVFNDKDDEDDDLADFFARYILCPVPYLILNQVTEPNEIMSFCNVNIKTAQNASKNVYNRLSVYGRQLFGNEKELIESMNPELLDVVDW